MPEFMVMILENEAEEAQLAPAQTKVLVEGHSAYQRMLRAASAYLDGERLRPSAEGRRVSALDGAPRVEAGPFGETALGGYYLLQADSLDGAVALAAQCPRSPGTSLDVRPVMKGKLRPEKASQQGRVFAFAVLGSAASEQDWIAVMDRIDATTQNNFPADRMLGGVRLHAPGQGRLVTSIGGQRAVFDGPFLESKEVIGGLMFMRMATVEEAVGWATQSEFVKYGAVEIRELWRS
ncbi:MAG TPA: YciI family protein [Polyangia bacterium]|jgi:hypothetical protein